MLNNIYASDSGKILILTAQIAIQTFTLPLPEAGLCYKIIAGNTIAFAVTIATNPGGLFYGSLSNLSTVPLTDVNTGGAGTAVNIRLEKVEPTMLYLVQPHVQEILLKWFVIVIPGRVSITGTGTVLA